MAVSFPRPDPSSPASIASANFGTARKGFNQNDVREFLALVAAEMDRLRERQQYLEAALLEAKDSENISAELIDEDTATRLLGEEAAHILHAARESAASVRSKAEEGASTILGGATEEATRVREEAEVEAARRRSEATADAENQIAMAKQQGRDIVHEARAYCERVLGELSSRRDLARTQLEQLVRGREQLLGTFTEARDTADSVIRTLGPLGDAAIPFDLPPPPPGTPSPSVQPADPGEPGVVGPVSELDSVVDEELRTGVSGGRVVELFPGSAEAPDDAPGVERDEDLTQSATVDSLFAKLRAANVDDDVPSSPTAEPTTPEELAALHDTTGPPVTEARGAGLSTDGSKTAQSFGPRDVKRTRSGDEGSASNDEQPSERSERGQQHQPGERSERGQQHQPGEPQAGDTDAEMTGVTSPFARRDAELSPLIVAAARRMKRVLADEQNELLDTLRQSEPVVSIDALVAADGQQAARYVDAITTELESAAQAGAASVSGDATTDVTRAGALGPVRDLIALNLVAPLRERLERCVADGEGDNDAISKRVRSVYREWKTQHVDNELDDVFRLAYGRGVLVALPVGTPVRWLVDPNGPACPDAEDNSLAGTVPAGDPFPTGHVCAPAHAECRCLLGPAEQ